MIPQETNLSSDRSAPPALPDLPEPPAELTPYIIDLVRRGVDDIGRAPDGAQEDTLNATAFRIGRLVGAGAIGLEDACRSLEDAGLAMHSYDARRPWTAGYIRYKVRRSVSQGAAKPDPIYAIQQRGAGIQYANMPTVPPSGAVVLLSQLTGDYGGNFTVWPGSHIFFENHFKEHGHEILGEGMPKVDLPNEPVQITGEPGDAILTHHQIVHTAAPNTSSHIRYATIFRLRHKDCDEIGTRRLHRYMAQMARHPGGADRTGSSTAEAPIPGPLAHIGKRG